MTSTPLLALAILPLALGFPGDDCPTPEWKKYTFPAPDGTVKCYKLAGPRGMGSFKQACYDIHPEARPALLETQQVVDFIRSEVIGNNDKYLVGYYADENGVFFDYMDYKPRHPDIIDAYIAKDAVVYITKDDMVFEPFDYNKGAICSVTLLPVIPYNPEPCYRETECPDGWERKDFGYATKCLKAYQAPVIYRCNISEICRGAHPSALPASIRTQLEKEYLRQQSEAIGSYYLFTGMHIPCDPDLERDQYGEYQYVQPNGEHVLPEIPDAIDNHDYAFGPRLSKSHIYESILGQYLGAGLHDLMSLFELGAQDYVLCEIYLPQRGKDCKSNTSDYCFNDDDDDLCFSETLFPYKSPYK